MALLFGLIWKILNWIHSKVKHFEFYFFNNNFQTESVKDSHGSKEIS